MKKTRILWVLSALACLSACSITDLTSQSQGASSLPSISPDSSSDSLVQSSDNSIYSIYLNYVKNAAGKGETPLSYEEWLASIKGEKGEPGEKGDPGEKGEAGPQGDKGEPGRGITSISKVASNGLEDTYVIAYSDGTTSTFVVTNGAQGEQGIQGIQGVPGEDGHSPEVKVGANGNWFVDNADTGIPAQGPKGDKGEQGEQGPKGDKGDQGEQGPKGDKGEQGQQGETGQDGKSAYEIYKEAHPEYEGDEQQWLDDLVNGRLDTEEKEYFTVTFDLGYDDLSFTQKVQKYGKASRPENPTRNGYNFIDWVDEYGDHWVFNGYSITEDITLRAVWSNPDEYTVTFVNNDGMPLDVQTGIYGDAIVYNGPTPVAVNQNPHYTYTFSGWDKPLIVTGNMTITATYVTNYITTTAYYYDYDGETLLATVPLVEGELPHYDGEIPTRARDYVNKLQFEFEGWDKAEETSSSIKFVARYTSCTDGLTIGGDTVVKYNGTSNNVSIPSVWNGLVITSIGDSAFNGCSSLSSVNLPDSVKSIGKSAFSGCTSLTSVAIPASTTLIGNSAFSSCYSLASISMSSSVTSIGDSAFESCSSLSSVTLPDSLKSIGKSAFRVCSSLSAVTIPGSVTSIGDSAFRACSSLISVLIPSSVTSIGQYAFSSCGSCVVYCEREQSSNYWNSSWSGTNPVVWGFKGHRQSGIFSYAVSEIEGNQTAVILGVDGNPTELVIPSMLDGMQTSLFSSALLPLKESLVSLTFENGSTLMDGWSFQGFTSLRNVALPEDIPSIRDSAFRGCSSLSSVIIPNSVTTIGAYAFERCSSLASVNIPSSVTSIGNSAFNGCTSLGSINIPSSVTSIGSSAFYGCSSLKIYCEVSSRPSGWNSNWNNSSRPVYWDATLFVESGFGFILSGVGEDCEAIVMSYVGEPTTSLTIPPTLMGVKVTGIGDGAFEGNSQLCSIALPDTLTSIGQGSFRNCASLKTIVIPASVASIRNSAFYGCSSLSICCGALSQPSGWDSNWNLSGRPVYWGTTFLVESGFTFVLSGEGEDRAATIVDYAGDPVASLMIPSTLGGAKVTGIGDGAFEGNSQLCSIALPDTLTSIGQGSFRNCASLKTIVIPASVASIGNSAFYGCSSLSSVSIPNSVTSIGDYTFCECYSLSSVNIPSSVTSIGSGAFSGCSSLTEVSIPSGVTSIGGSAFTGCASLEYIFIPSSVTTIGAFAFSGCDVLSIFCEAPSKPSGWDDDWNAWGLLMRPVEWGVTQ